MASPKIILYTNHICPWAHRVHIALAELGLEYEEVFIDLTKPREPWYLEIQPKGIIPTLKYGDHIITESAVISEFLSDLKPSHLAAAPYTVEGALSRARTRVFVDTFVSKLIPLYAASIKHDTPGSAEHNAIGDDWVATVTKDIEPLLAGVGPFFGGSDKLTLAEVLTGGFLLRFWALSKAENGGFIPAFALKKLEELPNFGKWAKALLAHPSNLKIWEEKSVVAASLRHFGKSLPQ